MIFKAASKPSSTFDQLDVMTKIEISALLSCIQAGVVYQSRVSRIMRTISESVHLVRFHRPVDERRYKNSTELKRINLFVSRNASRLMTGTQREFVAGTVLEHPLPLEKMYLELFSLATLTSEGVIELLGRCPLITVTKEEDGRLKHSGWASPAHRYKEAHIDLGRVLDIKFGSEPTWKALTMDRLADWSA
jgi:hypothetical protein